MNLQEHIRKVLHENTISLKNDPVKYFYYKFLKEEPLEFEGVYLIPNWDDGMILWEVDNPNDFSYSKDMLISNIEEEFITFCDMTATNYVKYRHFACWMENIPNGCYISKQDRKEINKLGEQIKEIKFEGKINSYEFNYDYKKTIISTEYNEVGINVYGDITNLKVTNKILKITRTERGRSFLNDMNDVDREWWDEELFDILGPIGNIFSNNPRMYDDGDYYFNLYLGSL